MKEKIIAGLDDIKIDIAKSVLEELEIQKNCKKMLPKIKEYFSQALDEYADWKIKECLPERGIDWQQEGRRKELRGYTKGFNDCIDQILSNKDKK